LSRYSEREIESGRRAMRRLLAMSDVMRPEGMGRHDLFRESSRIEEGRRWFVISQMRRLMLIQSRSIGRRDMVKMREGEVFVVRRGPDSAVARAKNVCGIVTHSMLDLEKR
jgi:hypothetical protein